MYFEEMILDFGEEWNVKAGGVKDPFLVRHLLQAVLPEKSPGNISEKVLVSGNLEVLLQPKIAPSSDKSIGCPYGVFPRLLLFWMTKEALRSKSHRLNLGHSLADFMRELGLDSHKEGRFSNAQRLLTQMERLFQAIIVFREKDEKGTEREEEKLSMQVAPEKKLWRDIKNLHQAELWESWIELSPDFFKSITAFPVDVDMKALSFLKNSSLALDLYAWTLYKAFQVNITQKDYMLPWGLLRSQFGIKYRNTGEFSSEAWKAILNIKKVFQALNIKRLPNGIGIFH